MSNNDITFCIDFIRYFQPNFAEITIELRLSLVETIIFQLFFLKLLIVTATSVVSAPFWTSSFEGSSNLAFFSGVTSAISSVLGASASVTFLLTASAGAASKRKTKKQKTFRLTSQNCYLNSTPSQSSHTTQIKNITLPPVASPLASALAVSSTPFSAGAVSAVAVASEVAAGASASAAASVSSAAAAVATASLPPPFSLASSLLVLSATASASPFSVVVASSTAAGVSAATTSLSFFVASTSSVATFSTTASL
uniref:Uncharacterized protein n=1 Tax=Glossina brevipalpis TaxID=37001 RepID=A0A1A9VZX4_9MUSC